MKYSYLPTTRTPGSWQQVCSLFGCGTVYEALSDSTPCPECGFSERLINLYGNDPEIAETLRREKKR